MNQVNGEVGMKTSNQRDNGEGDSNCVDSEGNENGAEHKTSGGNDMGEVKETDVPH